MKGLYVYRSDKNFFFIVTRPQIEGLIGKEVQIDDVKFTMDWKSIELVTQDLSTINLFERYGLLNGELKKC